MLDLKDYFGAVGDGVTDDTSSARAAAESGLTVYAPKGTYLLTDTVDFSGSHGQGLLGEGRSTLGGFGLTRFICPTGKPAFRFTNYHQWMRQISVWGDMSETDQTGVFVGLDYVPGWMIHECSFHQLRTGIHNEANLEGAGGSDCGSCCNNYFDRCFTGFNGRNNRDFTLFHGNSLSNCNVAVSVHNGGLDIRGGVWGGNAKHLYAENGAFIEMAGVFLEGIREDSDTGYIYITGNSSLTLGRCFQQVASTDPEGLPFAVADSGCVIQSTGNEFKTFFANGGQIFGNGETVNWNNRFTAAAGSYFMLGADMSLPLPSEHPLAPSALLRGRTLLYIDWQTGTADRLLRCLNVGSGIYAWVDL